MRCAPAAGQPPRSLQEPFPPHASPPQHPSAAAFPPSRRGWCERTQKPPKETPKHRKLFQNTVNPEHPKTPPRAPNLPKPNTHQNARTRPKKQQKTCQNAQPCKISFLLGTVFVIAFPLLLLVCRSCTKHSNSTWQGTQISPITPKMPFWNIGFSGSADTCLGHGNPIKPHCRRLLLSSCSLGSFRSEAGIPETDITSQRVSQRNASDR